jgi:hypothetical protein
MFPPGLPVDVHFRAGSFIRYAEDDAGQVSGKAGGSIEPQRCLAALFVAILQK